MSPMFKEKTIAVVLEDKPASGSPGRLEKLDSRFHRRTGVGLENLHC